MQNRLLDGRARTALVALCVLGSVVTTGTATGCKAKLGNRNLDAGDPSLPVARKANASGLRRAVTNYLTANLKPTHRGGGEKLIALDRLKGQPTIVRDGPRASFRGRARVFVRTSSGEDQTRIERVTCSLTQGAAGWTVQMCKVGPTVVAARSKGSNKAHPVDGGDFGDGSIGVPSCDRLLEFFRCIARKLPESAQTSMKKSYRTMIQTYRKMATNPAGRKSVAKSCEMAVKAMAKNTQSNALYKGCL